MSLIKKIKNYFHKKNRIKKLSTLLTNNQVDQMFSKDKNRLKTIVFVATSIPEFDKDSGANRFYELVKIFIELDYKTVICTENTGFENPYLKQYQNLGAIVYFDNSMSDNYLDFLKKYISKSEIVWYYGPNAFMKYHRKIKKVLPKSKIVYDMVDIHHLRIKRAIELEATRISNKKRFKKYFEIETTFSKNADWIITISDEEKEFMTKYIPSEKLITISNIHYIKVNKSKTLLFNNRNDLLFIGSSHSPNIDSVYYLYKEIMPIVWEKLPQLKVNSIGNLNEIITDIVDDRMVFHGYVSDIEPFFITNKFMIAPLRYGAGVKGKIGQAFEYYLPVISTDIGVEGMNLIHNQNALIANSTTDFANEIINLYQNEVLWQKLQDNSEKSLYPFSVERVKKIINENFK
jgi:O-antigen biosynthesis protein